MIQFYSPDIASELELPESDSGHAVRVLRLKEGDEIFVVDGSGTRYRCRIAMAHHRHTSIEIIEKETICQFWRGDITIAVAPTKNNDRMEWLVEKLTEIGVNRIAPLRCDHSERKDIKTERLEKIAVAAMKQSLKATVPQIDDTLKLKDFIASDKSEQKFIAYCDPTIPRRLLTKEYTSGKSATVLIGPEGDFSPEEISYALECGYIPVSLGEARLRTETAAFVACQTIHTVNQINE